MTHTLHRAGDVESLNGDYVVFAMAAQGVNREGAAPKLRRFLEIALKHNPVNFGDMKTGNQFSVGRERVLRDIQDNSIVHAVFTDADVVSRLLDELRQADLGMSVVVSGLFEPVRACCQEASIGHPHTVEYSVDIHGQTHRLPDPEVLQISTMCGHGMISFNLIKHLTDKVVEGRLTAAAAATELAGNCHCGVFNPRRAAAILERMASLRRVKG